MIDTQIEMPKYECHKTVWALKINSVHIDGNNCVLTFCEPIPYAPIEVAIDWYDKHKPISGGYYVVYEDGYKSFSPCKAFEAGYTRI